jgi:hypothetical protein
MPTAPIRCELEDIQVANEFFPCLVTNFPFKYQGVPLSLSKKIPRAGLQPLVDKVADYLPFWKGQGMNCSGRLALIKSTLSAMPIFISISMGLPSWVHKALEKILKVFL